MAEYVLEQYKKEGKKLNIVLSNLNMSFVTLDARIQGYEDVLTAASPDDVSYDPSLNIFTNEPAEFTNKAIALLNMDSDINCILTTFNVPTTYCLAGIKQTGRKDVSIYGIELDPTICQCIKDGDVEAMLWHSPQTNAYMCLFSALRLINGDKDVPDYTDPDSYNVLVTKDNVDDFTEKSFDMTLE